MKNFPVLHTSARLIKRGNIVWLLDHFGGFDRVLYPVEALFLSLCSGQWTLEEVISLCMRIFSITRKEADRVVHTFSAIIKMSDSPETKSPRYNPQQFLCPVPDASALTEHFEAPIEICLSLTHACNFRCVYCFNAAAQKVEAELSTDQWIAILEQAHDFGVTNIILTGGEPLLHRGFPKILRTAVSYGMSPLICTNGSLIKEEMVGEWKELGIAVVQLSIDTPQKESFEDLTQCKGSFSRVVDAIHMLNKAGIAVLVKAVVMKSNLHEMPALVKLLEELGVHRLTLDRFDLGSGGRGNTDMLVSDLQMEELSHKILKRENRTMSVQVVQAKKHWRKPEDIISCGAFRRTLIVLPNGDVTTCEKIMDSSTLIVGNLAKESLVSLWNGEKIHSFLNPPAERLNPVCRSCQYIEKCKTGCFSAKQALGWSCYEMDPRCFFAPREGNPYATL